MSKNTLSHKGVCDKASLLVSSLSHVYDLVSKIKTSIPTFFFIAKTGHSSHTTILSDKLKIQQCDGYTISALKPHAVKLHLWSCEKKGDP